MNASEPPGSAGHPYTRAARIIIVSSVMFTFISYWRTAAVVLCDMSSTAYYIGGIVEQAIGACAPWFILAVLLFSYTVRQVYIESCSLFVRGGVYRVVKTALGGFMGKLAVSALMFDYILTGPISSVAAGQYIMGLILETLKSVNENLAFTDLDAEKLVRNWGSVLFAVLVTLYFYRQNIRGIHESSSKALKIMMATTVMGVIMIAWCLLTLAVDGARNKVPLAPDLDKKFVQEEGKEPEPRLNPVTGEQEDPLGFLDRVLPESVATELHNPTSWLSLIGLAGLFLAFGHSILAMSGEETLAQVYREVESPKLPNFKKAAFIVFVYSLILTGSISFLAVLLIPDDVRMKVYADNLIGGLAMNVIGPQWAKLLLNAFVVIVGFLILSGAVNTAIIGSNGVLNRVAEDGVLSDWFLRPHPRFGTTYRVLSLVVGLQLVTIVGSGGNMYILGEAYAFGVIWSFVFQAFSMLVLRFKDPRPREYKVPLNFTVGKVEVPVGLGLVFLVLVITAVMNFFTKEVATVGGIVFTIVFMCLFSFSERYHQRRRQGAAHEHLEQFNRQTADDISADSLGLTKRYRKLVAIRSPHNLFMLDRTLAETDPFTTDVIVMTAKPPPRDGAEIDTPDLDRYDQQLMTAVVSRAEKAGKHVVPVIVGADNPLHAILRMAKELQVQELILGASNKVTADELLEQVGFYWISLHEGTPAPLTVYVRSADREVTFDFEGGNRIPKISEREAKSIAELRAAGVGVHRVLLAHEGTSAASDLFMAVMTSLDPGVALDLATVPDLETNEVHANGRLEADRHKASQLERQVEVHTLNGKWGEELVRLATEGKYELLIVPLPPPGTSGLDWVDHVVTHAPCQVFLAARRVIPQEVLG